MKAVWPLISYIAVAFALGAVLAYPVYALLELCWHDAVPFQKVVHRTLKLSALLALWPLMQWLGLSSRSQWGYGTTVSSFAAALSLGFMFGIASLGLVVAFLVLVDVRVLTHPQEMTLVASLVALGEAMAAALIVGLIEETWFRGALFSAISMDLHAVRAVWVTALLFGAVHFVRADPDLAPLDPSWVAGFTVIAHSFYQFSDSAFIDSFLALVAAGFLLGLMRQRSGHIAACIGVHAGWVTVIKTTRMVSEVNADSPLAFLIGSYDGVIGYLAFLVFGLLSVGYYGLALRGASTGRTNNQTSVLR